MLPELSSSFFFFSVCLKPTRRAKTAWNLPNNYCFGFVLLLSSGKSWVRREKAFVFSFMQMETFCDKIWCLLIILYYFLSMRIISNRVQHIHFLKIPVLLHFFQRVFLGANIRNIYRLFWSVFWTLLEK